jgi:hypothetical protein
MGEKIEKGKNTQNTKKGKNGEKGKPTKKNVTCYITLLIREV